MLCRFWCHKNNKLKTFFSRDEIYWFFLFIPQLPEHCGPDHRSWHNGGGDDLRDPDRRDRSIGGFHPCTFNDGARLTECRSRHANGRRNCRCAGGVCRLWCRIRAHDHRIQSSSVHCYFGDDVYCSGFGQHDYQWLADHRFPTLVPTPFSYPGFILGSILWFRTPVWYPGFIAHLYPDRQNTVSHPPKI